MTRARYQIVIVYYLVSRMNRLDDVRARARKAAHKLGIANKDLCACMLTPWGKRYLTHVRMRYMREGKGMRRTLT